jgi:AbrB family looped-hinge helix DNA binding protein
VTIPKSIRDKVGLRIGDVMEVTADDTGHIMATKLETEKNSPLDLGEDFGRKHRITEADVIRVSRSTRREVFKEEYE